MKDFWVFGYGSLMWRPGFEHLDACHARIFGLHRALCIHSWVHRGTRERPGLVLGLDRGGTALGMAFRVAGAEREAVVAYLRSRELVTNVYVETERAIRLDNGKNVRALTYVVDPSHVQYAGRLPHDALVRQVCGAVGQSGPNEDYVLQTVLQLRRMGIHDHALERLAHALGDDGDGVEPPSQ